MRQASILRQSRKGKRRTSQTKTVPAPVRGWNRIDSVANMEPDFATILENWWPTTADIQVRRGWDDHVTGLTAQVESLMPYVKPDGTEILFAAEGTDFFNVTSAGAVGAAVVSSLSNARWDSINFTNTSGTSYLCCFNGVDAPQYWDNSSWTAITGISSPAITGVTATGLKAPWTHQRRLWMIEADTLKAWFLPVDAVGGAAEALDLSGICKRGGHLVAGGAYTFDGGDGPDDYIFFVSSEGEVVGYQGTDPTSLSTWRIVGVWYVGEPVGMRPVFRFRGEALLLLKSGILPLSKALISSGTDKTTAITFNIQDAISEAVVAYKANFGWQIELFPEQNMLILNVPVAEGANQQQYCMNTITGAWTSFDGIDANCWAKMNGEMYFGRNTAVCKIWGSDADNGVNITADLQQAFSSLDKPGMVKEVRMVKPFIFSDGQPSTLLGVNVDFEETLPTNTPTFSSVAIALWDTATWDNGVWGGVRLLNDWQTCHGVGEYVALRLQVATKGIEVRLKATNYLYEPGAIVE